MVACFCWMHFTGTRSSRTQYLINLGYIALALSTKSAMTTLREAIELESVKIGVVMLILGGMHFFNILMFAKMRRRGVTTTQIPPPPSPYSQAA